MFAVTPGPKNLANPCVEGGRLFGIVFQRYHAHSTLHIRLDDL